MKKKRNIVRTTLTTLALVLVLVGSVTVVAIGTQLTHATNESSYLWGKKYGKYEWENCTTSPNNNGDEPSCDSAAWDCKSPIAVGVKNETTGHYDVKIENIVSNRTACINGWVHTWNHLCNPVDTPYFSTNFGCPTTVETAQTRLVD